MSDERPTIRVFEINDYDWWAGPDLETTIAAYRQDQRQCCGVDEDDIETEDAHEVSDEAMARLKFHGEDGTRTFAEELARLVASGATFPCFFASTEY